jgi:hypothetical protein
MSSSSGFIRQNRVFKKQQQEQAFVLWLSEA